MQESRGHGRIPTGCRVTLPVLLLEGPDIGQGALYARGKGARRSNYSPRFFACPLFPPTDPCCCALPCGWFTSALVRRIINEIASNSKRPMASGGAVGSRAGFTEFRDGDSLDPQADDREEFGSNYLRSDSQSYLQTTLASRVFKGGYTRGPARSRRSASCDAS